MNRKTGMQAFAWALGLGGSLSLATPLASAASDVVISQIYGGGGQSGSPFNADYVELFNRGTTPAALAGWSVQYASANGTTWTRTDLPAVSLAPGQYFLIQQASGGSAGALLPAADVTGTMNLANNAGKVAVVNNTTTLSGGCPSSSSIVDFIGYGNSATCFETASTGNLGVTTAAVRNSGGCMDSDNNPVDFGIITPNPRNTASSQNPCIPVGTEASTWGKVKASYRD